MAEREKAEGKASFDYSFSDWFDPGTITNIMDFA